MSVLKNIAARVQHWFFYLWERRLTPRFFDALPDPMLQHYYWVQSIWLPRALYTAVALGIPELLHAKGPQTAEQLATAAGAHAPSLYRILRLLAAFQVFSEDAQRRFSLTRDSRNLLPSDPRSMRYWILQTGNESWQTSNHVLEAVKTGRTGMQLMGHATLWDYYRDKPEATLNFIRGMDAFTAMHAPVVAAAYDFGKYGKIVDVGGGRAGMLMEILRRYPRVQGVVFDGPATADEARQRIAAAGLADRGDAIGGSFLDSVPPGADAYIIKHVLHDWDDEHAEKILRNIRQAMRPDSTLLIITPLLIEGDGQDRMLKLLDIQEMIELGGHVRTRAEYHTLCEKVGLKLGDAHPTPIPDAWIVEVRPV